MKRIATIAALLFATAARAEEAAALFQAKCKLCHGPDGRGSPVGRTMGAKDLSATKLSAADAAQVIENGRNKMAGFKGKLTDPEIEALAAYVAGGLKK